MNLALVFPIPSPPLLLFPPLSEGPCLIHSMNGDLLRTLEGPENCLRPKLIQASREGHCVIFYEHGHFCTFSVNGTLQASVGTDDHIRVSAHRWPTTLVFPGWLVSKQGRLWGSWQGLGRPSGIL